MKEKIELEVVYPDSPEQVWHAITDPALVSRWLMPTDFKPEVGYRFSFVGKGSGSFERITGEVIECDGKSRLVYTWEDGENGQPSVVSWTLSPDGNGTKLRLEHEPLEAAETYVLIEANMNWRYATARSLPALLGSIRNQPVPIVYAADEPTVPVLSRAGFRQPVEQEEGVPCA